MIKRSYAIFTIIILIYYCIFDIYFDTNDDIGIGMIALGYGISVEPTNNLLFSNFIIAYIVRILSVVFGLNAYNAYTIIILLISIYVISRVFNKIKIPEDMQLILYMILFFKCAVFPQFTINSGVCAIAGVLSYVIGIREKNQFKISLAMVLLCISFSIRAEMFMLIMYLSIPILHYNLFKEGFESLLKFTYHLCILIIGIVVLKLIEIHINGGSLYEKFYQFQAMRVLLIDFNGLNHLNSIACFSKNDIELMKNWFFEFIDINNLTCLNSTIEEINIDIKAKIYAVKYAFFALASKEILPYTIITIVYLIKSKNTHANVTALLIVVAVIIMGFWERGGQARVYIPMLVLCTIYTIVLSKLSNEKN
jgi:hypothetical protein